MFQKPAARSLAPKNTASTSRKLTAAIPCGELNASEKHFNSRGPHFLRLAVGFSEFSVGCQGMAYVGLEVWVRGGGGGVELRISLP